MSQETSVTIGNFDGVHRGHQALIDRARKIVGPDGRVVVMAFASHPLSLLRPGSAPARLSSDTQRKRWLFEQGVDEVEWIPTSAEILHQNPDEFLDQVCRRFRPTWIVEGPDFRFGRGRTGDVETLQRLSGPMGFDVDVVPVTTVTLSDHAVVRASSSMARWLVERGRCRDTEEVLGRPFEVESTVERGHQRGRGIGFPTANLAPNGCLLPLDGVYSGVAWLPDNISRPAAISVGTNPTFAGQERICEAHLLDFDGPLDQYGWTIRLSFHAWLRDQIRYAAVEPLIEQLRRDVSRTRELQERRLVHSA